MSIRGEIWLQNVGTVTGLREAGPEINASNRGVAGNPQRDNFTFIRAVIGEASASEAAALGVAPNTIILRYQRNSSDTAEERFEAFSLAGAGGYSNWGEIKIVFARQGVTDNYSITVTYGGTVIVSEVVPIAWYDPFWHTIRWVGPECDDRVRDWHTSIDPCIICDSIVGPIGDTAEFEYWYPDAEGNAIPQVGNLLEIKAQGAVTASAGGIGPLGLQFNYGAGGYHTLVYDLIDYGRDFTVFYWARPPTTSSVLRIVQYGPMSGDYNEGNVGCARAPDDPVNDAFTFQDDNLKFDAVNDTVSGHECQLTSDTLCEGQYTLESNNHAVQAAPAKNLYVFNYRPGSQDWRMTVGDNDKGILDSRVVQYTTPHDLWIKQKSPFAIDQPVNCLTFNYQANLLVAPGEVDQIGVFQKSFTSADLDYLWNGGVGNADLSPII